ncbi:hypothetical protein AC579_9808 [Pseudocercospora musae]|uniref:Uncharacterized protein n=1 Tax=Pseudocercospora musae TaxID=113226 RepID=A0A139IV87_9PEZI|nr:hypothetical protein AC579_9808 [Pseudocercospora musae]
MIGAKELTVMVKYCWASYHQLGRPDILAQSRPLRSSPCYNAAIARQEPRASGSCHKSLCIESAREHLHIVYGKLKRSVSLFVDPPWLFRSFNTDAASKNGIASGRCIEMKHRYRPLLNAIEHCLTMSSHTVTKTQASGHSVP